MSTQDSPTKRVGVFLPPGAGRSYPWDGLALSSKQTETKRKEGTQSRSGGWSLTRRVPELTHTPKTTFSM